MSEAYERERYGSLCPLRATDADHKLRQNNSRLDELASKVSALRGVTVDIYDNARDHQIIDDSVSIPIARIATAQVAHEPFP